jgi:hypothetical protein
MNMRKKIAVFIACCLLFGAGIAQAQTLDSTAVRNAIVRLSTTYPQATLQDVYKSFYQEHFGPSHLIPDTATARYYLMHELAEYDQATAFYYEFTGSEGRFVRVYLSAIADSLITAEQLLDAFVRSSDPVGQPAIDWQTKWAFIVEVVTRSGIRFDNFEQDAKLLREASLKGLEMRHSRVYNTAYHPHYRIIRRDIFDNEIKPHIAKK